MINFVSHKITQRNREDSWLSSLKNLVEAEKVEEEAGVEEELQILYSNCYGLVLLPEVSMYILLLLLVLFLFFLLRVFVVVGRKVAGKVVFVGGEMGWMEVVVYGCSGWNGEIVWW